MEHGSQDSSASTFCLTDEDHTLANSLRFTVNQDPRVTVCGYSIPHPAESLKIEHEKKTEQLRKMEIKRGDYIKTEKMKKEVEKLESRMTEQLVHRILQPGKKSMRLHPILNWMALPQPLPSNDKLDSAVLDSFPSPTEPVCSDEALEIDPHETGSLCERSSASSDVAEDDADVGKYITTEEIKYVSSLTIVAISIQHVATSFLEDSSRVLADSNDDLIAADHPPESSPELRTGLPELEVCAPDGAEVNVATASASPCNDIELL